MNAEILEPADFSVFSASQSGIKEEKATWKSVGWHFFYCFCVFVFIFLSYCWIKPCEDANRGTDIAGLCAKLYGLLLMLLPIGYGVYLYVKKKLTLQKAIYIILAVSFLLRLTYMLYTARDVRQHDTWSSNHNGHYDVALYIFENWALPNYAMSESSIYQFYHPPLSYFLQACWMKIFNVIGFVPSLKTSSEDLFAACQILSCFYTFLMSVYIVKTLRLTKLSQPSFYFACAFGVFFPRLIQLSGQLNNDDLSILFTICCIYRVQKWLSEGHSYKDFLLAGLYLGLAMMSKLSSVIVCLGLGVIFLLELIKSIQKKEGAAPLKGLIIQYVIFLAICAPIGLWFQVYAHKVYGIPYNFVFRALNSALFTGPRSYVISNSDFYSLSYYDKNNSGLIYTSDLYNIFFRYISPFYWPDVTYNPVYANAFNNYNILTYAIKSSIFGEFSFDSPFCAACGFLAVISAFLVWFALIAYFIFAIVKKQKLDKDALFHLLLVFSIVFFFLYLQVKMPFGCSMDFRYITAIILPISCLIGYSCDKMAVPELRKDNGAKIISGILKVSLAVFVASSVLFYMGAV